MRTFSIGMVIGATLSGSFGRSLGSARTKLSTLGDEIKGIRSQRGLIERFEKDQAALSKARIKLAATTRTVGRLKLALRKNPDDTGTAKALETTSNKAAKLSSSLEKQKSRLLKTERELKKAGIDVKNLGGQYTRLGRTLDKTRAKQARLEKVMARRSAAGKRLADLRNRVLAVGAAFYSVARLVGKSNVFEDAGARLATVLTSEDIGKSLEASRKHALAFSGGGNLATRTEIMGIEYALDSAGLDEATARIGSELVSKVSKITGGVSESVGEVMATVYNNLGEGLQGNAEEKFLRIGELLSRTQFKYQIKDFDQLGESMRYAAPSLAMYNVELAQGVTLLGELNTAGMPASQAGTALAATFRQMSRASEEFGFELSRNEKGQLDFIQTMENLSDAIGGFDGMDQDTIDRMQEAFGDEGQRAVVLLGKKLEGLRKAQDDVVESSRGIIDKKYQFFLNTTSGKLQILTNKLGRLGEIFSGSLKPKANEAIGVLGKIVDWSTSVLEKMPWVGEVIAGAGLMLGGLTTALAVVTAATWLWNTALLANPIGIVVGSVVGAAVLIFKYWKPLSSFFTKFWGKIKFAFMATPIGAMLVPIIGIARKIVKYWGPIKSVFATVWAGIRAAFTVGSAWLKSWWEKSTFKKIIGGVSWITGKLGGMFSGGSKVMETFAAGVQSKSDALRAAIEKSMENADELIPHSDAKKGPFSRLTESGFSIGSTMAAGVRKGAISLKKSMAGLFAGAMPDSPATVANSPRSGAGQAGHNIANIIAAVTAAGRPSDRSSRLTDVIADAAAARQPSETGGRGGVQVTFSPVINLPPGSNAGVVKASVDRSMQESEIRIKRIFERLMANDRRLSFT
jgi:TP901 family phage tail tape measure protein